MKVLVLGAGVVGVAAAYYLARAGHEVTVIERREGPGLETSFANGGQLLGETVELWLAPDVPTMVLKNFFRVDAPYRVRFSPMPERWLWGARFLRNCAASRVTRIREDLRRLAVHSLDALVERPELCQIVLVVAQPDKPAGRGRKLRPPAVAQRARELGLPLSQPVKVRSGDFPELIES